jgi:hypothetical protein
MESYPRKTQFMGAVCKSSNATVTEIIDLSG